jgi:hypothetical protein
LLIPPSKVALKPAKGLMSKRDSSYGGDFACDLKGSFLGSPPF